MTDKMQRQLDLAEKKLVAKYNAAVARLEKRLETQRRAAMARVEARTIRGVQKVEARLDARRAKALAQLRDKHERDHRKLKERHESVKRRREEAASKRAAARATKPDRQLVRLGKRLKAGQGDGRISKDDDARLHRAAMDGGRITASERAAIRLVTQTKASSPARRGRGTAAKRLSTPEVTRRRRQRTMPVAKKAGKKARTVVEETRRRQAAEDHARAVARDRRRLEELAEVQQAMAWYREQMSHATGIEREALKHKLAGQTEHANIIVRALETKVGQQFKVTRASRGAL